MTRLLILFVCAVAASASFMFMASTILYLAKAPKIDLYVMLELAIPFALFITASMTVTAAWQRKKLALWVWLPVFLYSLATVSSWTYETTKTHTFEFATQEEAHNRTGALFERPTMAEHLEHMHNMRLMFAGLLGILVLHMGALIYLRRTKVLT